MVLTRSLMHFPWTWRRPFLWWCLGSLGAEVKTRCSGCRRAAATGARCGGASAESCPLGGAVAERLGLPAGLEWGLN